MILRIAATADWHLSSSIPVFGRIIRGPDGVNIRWRDRLRCAMAVVDGAISNQCQLALLAADLFDTAKPTPAEYVAAEQVLDRLVSRMPVICLSGNHGNAESATERDDIEPLAGRHPDLHIIVRPEVLRLTIAGEIVQVACLPSPRRSTFLTKTEAVGLGPEAANAAISAKLRLILHGLRAEIDQSALSILCAHVLISGADMGGPTPSASAVSLTTHDLQGFDLVILGDIHKRQSFLDGRAWYTGSPDRMDFGEEAYRPGWLSVDVEHGQMPVVREHPTPAREYATMTLADLASEPLLASCAALGVDSAIFRVTGEISEADYDTLAPALARWRSIPTFADRLEVQRTVRARVAEMGADLTAETALRLWAESERRMEELPALLEAHAEIRG